MAPDRSDESLAECARDVASIMGRGAAPKATYEALDRSFAEMMRAAERGLGGADAGEIDAAMRDRLLGISPRAMFARLS